MLILASFLLVVGIALLMWVRAKFRFRARDPWGDGGSPVEIWILVLPLYLTAVLVLLARALGSPLAVPAILAVFFGLLAFMYGLWWLECFLGRDMLERRLEELKKRNDLDR